MRRPLVSAIVPVILLLGWELGGRFGSIDVRVFSKPTEVVVAGVGALLNGSMVLATLQTLEAAAFGLALGTVAGIAGGIFLGRKNFIEISSRPTVEILRSIPAIAFTPLALLVFGFGLSMEGTVVAYACVWPILISTLAATRNIEPRLLEVASVLELSPIRRLTSIIIPAVFSRVTVGLRTAIGFALVVSVTVEILVNPRGLGYALIVAQQSFRPDLMYAYLVWLAALGMAVGEASKLLDYAVGRRTV
jgi:ABC-type nitrate/sulfonate/bicarbonate transport system permease component